MRGLGAIYVLMYHAPQWFGPYTPDGAILFVDLFYVLSGFVLAAAYGERLGRSLSTWTFMKMRMIRLYPLFFVSLIPSTARLVASLVKQGGVTEVTANGWRSLLFSLFLLPTPSRDSSHMLYPLNDPAWTLLFELLINVLFAVTITLWTKRNLVVAMAIVGLLLFVTGEQGGGNEWRTFHLGLLRVGYSFPAGVLVYKLVADGLRVPRVPALACLATFPLMMLLPFSRGSAMSAPMLPCLLIGLPVLILFAAQASVPKYLVAPSVLIGNASYAMYIVHFPLYGIATGALKGATWSPNPLVLGVGAIGLITLLSIWLEAHVDVPIRARLTRRFIHR